MTLRAVRQRLVLIALAGAAACAGGRDAPPARVTIDMRCESTADCPGGFSCTPEQDHGPPTTMCESEAAVACPPGYATREGFGQTFCKSPAGAGARSPLLMSTGSYRAPGHKPRTTDGRIPWSAR